MKLTGLDTILTVTELERLEQIKNFRTKMDEALKVLNDLERAYNNVQQSHPDNFKLSHPHVTLLDNGRVVQEFLKLGIEFQINKQKERIQKIREEIKL